MKTIKQYLKSRTVWYGILSTVAGLFTLWYDNLMPLLSVVIGDSTPEKQLMIKSILLGLNGLAIMYLRKITTKPLSEK